MAGDAVGSMLFYLGSYALTNFAAWGVVVALEHGKGQGLDLADYAGLGQKVSLAGAGHAGCDALLYRDAADAGFLG